MKSYRVYMNFLDDPRRNTFDENTILHTQITKYIHQCTSAKNLIKNECDPGLKNDIKLIHSSPKLRLYERY